MTNSEQFAIVCLAALCSLLPACRKTPRSSVGNSPQVPTTLSPPATNEPLGIELKLDGQLIAVVRAYRSGGEVAAKALVQAKNVSTVAGRLRVGITVKHKKEVPIVRTRLQKLGADVTAELGTRLYAILPVQALVSIAEDERIWSIAVPRRIVSPVDD